MSKVIRDYKLPMNTSPVLLTTPIDPEVRGLAFDAEQEPWLLIASQAPGSVDARNRETGRVMVVVVESCADEPEPLGMGPGVFDFMGFVQPHEYQGSFYVRMRGFFHVYTRVLDNANG